MNTNEKALTDYYYGHLTFENFWGQNLKKVILTHSLGPAVTLLDDKKELGAVEDKEILTDILGFKYLIGTTTDYWHIAFWTQTGSIYESSLGFSCNITASDHGKVTLGINGESQRMYVSFPSSSTCSTAIHVK